MHACTQTYIHKHMHTRIHTHTHTYIQVSHVLKPKGRRKASEGPKITFKTPAGSSTERLRFKKGDGVLLSRTHPMTDMLADGNVLDVREGSVVIGLTESADGGAEAGGAGSGGGGGGLPDDFEASEWRLDKSANKTSYLRQLASLVKVRADAHWRAIKKACASARWLCRRLSEPWPLTIWLQVCERTRDKGEELSQGQERVFDLITSGAVGEVDDYVHAQTGRKNTHNARGDDGGSGGSGAGEEGQAVKAVEEGEGGHGAAAGGGAGGPGAGLVVKEAAAEAVLDGINFDALDQCEQDVACNSSLNRSQQVAISAALTRRLSIIQVSCLDLENSAGQMLSTSVSWFPLTRWLAVIQGPPGTGKTTASVEILRQWSKLGICLYEIIAVGTASGI